MAAKIGNLLVDKNQIRFSFTDKNQNYHFRNNLNFLMSTKFKYPFY